MAEIDTSSYPKPTAPTSPLDIAGKLGTLQSQALQINQQKLSQANEALTYLTRAMTAIGPDGSKDQYKRAGADAVNAGLVPPNMLGIWNKKIDDAPTPKSFFDEAMTAAAQHQETFNYHLGQIRPTDTGQGVRFDQIPGRGGSGTSRAFIPHQVPVTQPVQGPDNTPTLQGNQPQLSAPGIDQPISRRLPVAPPLPPGPMDPNALPRGAFRPGEVPTAAEVMPATTPSGPSGPRVGLPPGEPEAASASGQHLAQERVRAGNFQREIFPLTQAIPALEALGTKGTGPGTDTINQIKSFVLSNVPGVKESDFNGTVGDFDKSKKYLTDFVNQTGSTGTNDKLAAAFAGNPSVGISNAAAVDVAKSALALRRMQQAVYREFEVQGKPAQQFSRWYAQSIDKTDPRAFGVDMMTDEAKSKLRAQLKKNPVEEKRFEESLNMAVNMGFLTPRE
jgi:hypothetical protein